jgi:hypothetical protein
LRCLSLLIHIAGKAAKAGGWLQVEEDLSSEQNRQNSNLILGYNSGGEEDSSSVLE